MTPFSPDDNTRRVYTNTCLNIYEHSCVCGNTWTHSLLVPYAPDLIGGVRSSPMELASLPCTHTYRAPPVQHPTCFRCIPLDALRAPRYHYDPFAPFKSPTSNAPSAPARARTRRRAPTYDDLFGD